MSLTALTARQVEHVLNELGDPKGETGICFTVLSDLVFEGETCRLRSMMLDPSQIVIQMEPGVFTVYRKLPNPSEDKLWNRKSRYVVSRRIVAPVTES